MSFSYKKFISNIEEKGLTLNQLKLRGVLTGYAYERMIADKPVGIDKIADLCRYLNVPIDYVVEIKYEQESDDQAN